MSLTNGNVRGLRTTPVNRATFLWINSESENVRGTNSSWEYDISALPLSKNVAYQLQIKSVTYPNNSPQITSAYNYNRIKYEIVREVDNVVMTTRTLTLAEGTYDSAQLVFAFSQALNSDFLSVAGTYGGDPHTVAYSDITNRLTFRRTTFTAVGGNTFYVRLLGNDSLTQYNGAFGFGMAFVLGVAYGGVLTLPRASATADVACPNPPALTPYLYYSLLLEGINNANHSSDTPNIQNIVYRMPLTVGQGRYSYIYFETANVDQNTLYCSQLPSTLRFKIIDQYGQEFKSIPENAAIDLCMRIVPAE